MMIEQRIKDLTHLAVQRWGLKAQTIKTCEELAELTQQLCKYVNESPTVYEDLIDEIADVSIMVAQMTLAFGAAAVSERIHYKLDRLEKALARNE